MKNVIDAFKQELAKAGYVAHEADRIVSYLEHVFSVVVTDVKEEAVALETKLVAAVKTAAKKVVTKAAAGVESVETDLTKQG